MRLIDEEYMRHPFYGSPRMTDWLQSIGERVNHKRVERLMRQMGIMAVVPGPHTSRPHPEHEVYPYLLRDLAISRPHQVWAADITYIRMAKGFMYLVATNLLFFTKGAPTQTVWYWEHKIPDTMKAYSKTKPIRKSEFKNLEKWWNNREENEQAWQVDFAELEKNGFNLDIKNPHVPEDAKAYTSKEIIEKLEHSFEKSDHLLKKLKQEVTNG